MADKKTDGDPAYTLSCLFDQDIAEARAQGVTHYDCVVALASCLVMLMRQHPDAVFTMTRLTAGMIRSLQFFEKEQREKEAKQ